VSERPIIVCGTEIVPETTPALAADHAQLLLRANKRAGLFYLMPGANSFGGSLLGEDGISFLEILEEVEKGTVKGLILAESDPFYRFHDRQRLDQALEKLDLLVVLDYLNSPAVPKADVFLPSSTLYEGGGIFINQEGRVQAAPKAFLGGAPIAQVSGGDHPPRVYGSEIPGAEPRAAWLSIHQIADGDSLPVEDITRMNLIKWLGENIPAFSDVPAIDELPGEGVRINSADDAAPRFSLDWLEDRKGGQVPEDGLEVILTEWTFGTEELSSLSPPLGELEKSPCVFVHGDDLAGLSLSDGDTVAIKLEGGELDVRISAKLNMAPGVIVLPRHRLLEWQKIKELPKVVRFEEIEKKA
jgi:NADH-quinone oxidoreductase subunit G